MSVPTRAPRSSTTSIIRFQTVSRGSQTSSSMEAPLITYSIPQWRWIIARNLLRPGGRMVAVNTLNTRDGAFTICSPDWFLDYFVENGFSDCKVYVCAGFAGSYNSYWLDTEYIASQKPSRLVFPAMWWSYYTLVFAEKGPASTTERVPTQQTYRSAAEWTRYVMQLSAINHSQRPHLACGRGKQYCPAWRGADTAGWTRNSGRGP